MKKDFNFNNIPFRANDLNDIGDHYRFQRLGFFVLRGFLF